MWGGATVADIERERSCVALSLRLNGGPGRVFDSSEDCLFAECGTGAEDGPAEEEDKSTRVDEAGEVLVAPTAWAAMAAVSSWRG